jgi:hypothetical protein
MEQRLRNRPEDQIKQWTKEDYQNLEPYEWLYNFRDNAFQLERLRGMMLEDARAKKVSNAGVLWREYVKTQMSGQNRDIAQNVTAFTGQPLELRCGDYDCYDDGISYQNAFGGTTIVCSHPIMPTKRLVNIDSGEVRIEVSFSRGTGWRRAVFDKATLSNARQITALAGCGISVTSESAKELVKYLTAMEDMNYDQLPEEKTVGRLGWVDGYGFSPYVENLQYDGAALYGDAFKAVHESGSFDEWLEVAREVRAGASIPCRIALAASFAAPLVERMGALPFIVHLWGSVSGIGKSVALILAASVWAYPEIGSYVKTTRATVVGCEQMAAFCGNLPLCLDELQLIQNRKEFDELIYTLCEGASKTRGAKAGGVQAVQKWRNTILTNGEQPITTAGSKVGAVNRVIEVECTENLFRDPRAAYLKLVKNYGFAGKRFVKTLTEHSDAMELAMDMQKQYYDALSGLATDKQILSASLLLAADAMAEMLIFEDGKLLTPDDIKPYLVTQEQADTNVRAYDWLCDFIACNPSRFNPNSFGDYSGECWGTVDESAGKAYIIKGVFDRIMNDAGFNPASFLSWADRKGRIERQGGKRTKVKRLNGTITRCVVLDVISGFNDENSTIETDSEALKQFEQMEGGR